MSGERNKKVRSGWLRFIVLIVCFFLVISGIRIFRDVNGIGRDNVEFVVEIPNGAGSSSIADILEKYEIVKFPNVFKAYARLSGAPIYQKGGHTLNQGMSYGEILDKLSKAPDVDDENNRRVVIPEGYELRQIVDLLVENGLGDEFVFMEEIENGVFEFSFIADIPERENRLEGYLYPDTYMFSLNETEHEIINKMLKAFNEKMLPIYECVDTPYSLDESITLASVIEREAANDEERPLVSSVFHNRLAIGMKLESCATVQYIIKERKPVLSTEDTAIDSSYNTYKYEGLPIGPIASPGAKSLEAALLPADTDYMYFLAEADGSGNLFSKTFDEHNQKTVETQG